jgi:glycine cleavage system H protein
LSTSYIVPEDLYYSKEHEWLRIEGDHVVVGITDYAQKSLHEVVFVELPKVGKRVGQMEVIGTAESVKAVSEIYSPASGEIIGVNGKLAKSPEMVNKDPYGEGWIAKLRPANIEEDLKRLMTAGEYRKYLEKIEKGKGSM